MQDFGTIPLKAGATINAFRFLKGGAADKTVIQGDAAGDVLLGVSKHSATADKHLDVQILGVAKVEAGAAVTRFSRVTSDAQGRAVNAAPAAGVNNGVGGVALEAATAAGDLIDVLLITHTLQG